jgi:hypothetical protein
MSSMYSIVINHFSHFKHKVNASSKHKGKVCLQIFPEYRLFSNHTLNKLAFLCFGYSDSAISYFSETHRQEIFSFSNSMGRIFCSFKAMLSGPEFTEPFCPLEESRSDRAK